MIASSTPAPRAPHHSRAIRQACAVETLEHRRLLASVPPGFNTDVAYGTGFGNGTAMDFSPDGRLWATTQNGQVMVIPAGGGATTVALTLTVDSFFERGLLGIAFDPSFDANAPGTDYVYLFHTVPSAQGGPYNAISRFEVTGNTIVAGSQTQIFRFNQLSAGNHNGGAIHFGPDGMLYAAHGENAVTSNSQSINNLLGKVVRINPSTFVPGDPESVVPGDNPTTFPGVAGSPAGINRAIWSLGLRNPYTFAFQPGTTRMHINDVGSGASSWEEVNPGLPGRNYGWPNQEGLNPPPPGNPNHTYPVYTYPRAEGATIVGGAFYNTPAHTFPADYLGDYIFADLSTGWLRRLDAANNYALQTTGGASGSNWVVGTSAPVDVKIGPDGGLYFLQRGGGNGGAGVRVIHPTNPLPYVNNSQFVFNGFVQPQPPHRLRFSFSEDVSSTIGPDDLLVENLTTMTTIPSGDISMVYEPATNTAVFAFTGLPNGILPDGRYRATLTGAGIMDPSGQAMAINPTFEFFFLNGDANRDARVNLTDFNTLAQNFGQTPRDFTQGDFDYNNIVNLADFNILAARFGQVLAGPSTTSASMFGTTRVGGEDKDSSEDEELLA
jgi:glucose/arabinose dehydrogenase